MNLNEELTKDPLVNKPVELIDTDYKDGYLIFTLNHNIPYQWANILNEHNYEYQSFVGYGPEKFEIKNNIARIYLNNDFTKYKELVNNFKQYITKANEVYKNKRTNEILSKIMQIEENDIRLANEEKRRQEILRQINS